jgi:hypothetical protein
MSVDNSISLQRIKKELEPCFLYGSNCGWVFSDIDESNQSFNVRMQSPLLDKDYYLLEVVFNDYPEIPLLLDFIDIRSGERGKPYSYPKNNDSFFHPFPCICNPCSRKSYKSFDEKAPHGDWQMIGWQNNTQVGTLTNLESILKTIYLRICKPETYEGRMGK